MNMGARYNNSRSTNLAFKKAVAVAAPPSIITLLQSSFAMSAGARMTSHPSGASPLPSMTLRGCLCSRPASRTFNCGASAITVPDPTNIASARARSIWLWARAMSPVIHRLLPSAMFLGVSTHSLAEARQAEQDGADYVAVGSIYPTATKPEFQLVGLDLLRAIRPQVKVPLVGIGGITADNAARVIEAGADGVAVISAVCGARDPAEVTRLLLDRIRAAKALR